MEKDIPASPLNKSPYHFDLPPELIAKVPAYPRHAARLMVYDTKSDEVHFDTFANLGCYMPPHALMVLNETRVVPARLPLSLLGGSSLSEPQEAFTVEALFLVNEIGATDPNGTGDGGYGGHGATSDQGMLFSPEGSLIVPALINKKVNVGQKLLHAASGQTFVVLDKKNESYYVGVFGVKSVATFLAFLEKEGQTPLPPYIDSPLSEGERRAEYQTVFAEGSKSAGSTNAGPVTGPVTGPAAGSVAAPTASLHFDDTVFASLDDAGVERTTLSLHVGRGTFLPVRPAQLSRGELHKEWYTIPEATVEKLHAARGQSGHVDNGRPIVAVGTTVVRTLESAAAMMLSDIRLEDAQREDDENGGGSDEESGAESIRSELDTFCPHNFASTITGSTSIFIKPPHHFKFVDALVTNFHWADSSLMYLVDAFLQDKKAKRGILELYNLAIAKGFRFYSFGDGMLIL